MTDFETMLVPEQHSAWFDEQCSQRGLQACAYDGIYPMARRLFAVAGDTTARALLAKDLEARILAPTSMNTQQAYASRFS